MSCDLKLVTLLHCRARGSTFTEMYRRVGRRGLVRDWWEGVQRVREAAEQQHGEDGHGFAFLTEKPLAEYIAGNMIFLLSFGVLQNSPQD